MQITEWADALNRLEWSMPSHTGLRVDVNRNGTVCTWRRRGTQGNGFAPYLLRAASTSSSSSSSSPFLYPFWQSAERVGKAFTDSGLCIQNRRGIFSKVWVEAVPPVLSWTKGICV